MYGYQMIEELAKRSNDTFALKAGTLYPILHTLEAEGSIESYEQPGGPVTAGKPRRYYRITSAGSGVLEARQTEWRRVSRAINAVLDACRTGGDGCSAARSVFRSGGDGHSAARSVCRTGGDGYSTARSVCRTGSAALLSVPDTRRTGACTGVPTGSRMVKEGL